MAFGFGAPHSILFEHAGIFDGRSDQLNELNGAEIPPYYTSPTTVDKAQN